MSPLATPAFGSPPSVVGTTTARPVWLWPLVAATLAYLMLVSRDVDVAGVPAKVLLVGAALVTWYTHRGRGGRLRAFRAATPVLVVGLLVPIAWTAVAVIGQANGSSAATVAPRDALEEASRFGYLLMYFPIADLLGSADRHRQLTWLVPAAAIVPVTWGLWLILRYGEPSWMNTSSVLTFTGIFGVQAGVTRTFFGNQVLLAPLLAWLMACSLRGMPLRLAAMGIIAVLSAVFLAHTRGLWVAVLGAAAAVAVLGHPTLGRLAARFVVPGLVLGVLAAFALGAALLGGALAPQLLDDASSAQRVGQASSLFDAWGASPIVGSGMGAALANGLTRASRDAWSFELTYLQLLFQTGILGLGLILWPLGTAVVAGVRGLAGGERTSALPAQLMTGVAATAAVYIAALTNPFLLSSFGMVCVALGLALVSGRPPGDPEPPKRRRWLGVVAVLIVCAGLTGYEFLAPRTESGSDPAAADVSDLRMLGTFRLAPEPGRSARFLTDGDLRAREEPLHALSFRGRSVRLASYRLVGDGGRRRPFATVRVPDVPAARSALYDVTRWGQSTTAAADLAIVRAGETRVTTRIVSLDGRASTRAQGTATIPPTPKGTFREIAVLRTPYGDGRRPDVLIFDRPSGQAGMTVTVLRGADEYRVVGSRFRAALPGTDPRYWRVDAAAVFRRTTSSAPLDRSVSATFFVANQPRREQFEVHAATADLDFRAFVDERKTELGAGLGPAWQAVVGQRDGVPVSVVVHGRGAGARVEVIESRHNPAPR